MARSLSVYSARPVPKGSLWYEHDLLRVRLMMSTKPTAVATRDRSSALLGRLRYALIEPLAAHDDLTLRRTARLLTILLLALMALFLLVDITRACTTPGYQPPW